MKLRTLLKFLSGAIVLAIGGFLAIQLIPVSKTNPPVVNEPAWDSPQTRQLVKRACFDCHSNETNWPWYSNVAPVSWVVVHHVNEGRRKVNFSNWSPAQKREVIETVLEGEMPPLYYRLTNPQARLTPAETDALVKGLQATFGLQSGHYDPAADALRRFAGQYKGNDPAAPTADNRPAADDHGDDHAGEHAKPDHEDD